MFSSEAALIGILESEIDTPALVIDLDVLESNIAKMGSYFATTHSKLRPHFKTHKCPILAQKQLAAGAVGLACAKVEEAEVLVLSGVTRNILIANQVVTRQKIAKLMGLNRHAEVMVCVDDPVNVSDLSDAACHFGVSVGVFVEVNVGMNRCGVNSPAEAVSLAQQVCAATGLRFAGLQGYEGHVVHIADAEVRRKAARNDLSRLLEAKREVEAAGMKVLLVDSGGTGSYNITGEIEGIDEIQAGSYLFSDVSYLRVLKDFLPSLRILTTVVSHQSKSRVVTDAGMKAASIDQALPEPIGVTGLKVAKLAEEHCLIDVEAGAADVRVGQKISLIPGHVCTTVNLHDKYYGVRNGIVEVIWEIAGRGKCR